MGKTLRRRKLLLQRLGKADAKEAGSGQAGEEEGYGYCIGCANAGKQEGYAFSDGAIPLAFNMQDGAVGNPRGEEAGQIHQGLADRVELVPVGQTGQG